MGRRSIIGRVPAPAILALALLFALLILIPARRLQAAGFPSGAIGIYAVVVWGLAMVLAVAPVAGRILVPLLIVLYGAPFITAPAALRRIVGRRARDTTAETPRPPIKNVTPPEARYPAEPGDDTPGR
jgi:hypothetical protein